MPLPRCPTFLALVLLAVTAGRAESAPAPVAAAVPVVWRLTQADTVRGLATTVLGAPKPVPAPGGGGLQFNGDADGVFVPVNPIEGRTAFTIEILFAPDPDGRPEQRFLHVQDSAGARALIEIRVDGTGQWWLDTFLRTNDPGRALIDPAKKHPTGQWYWAALRYDGKTMSDYVNGALEGTGEVAFSPMVAGQVSVGVRQNKVFWFKGRIAEVRFTPDAIPLENLQRIER